MTKPPALLTQAEPSEARERFPLPPEARLFTLPRVCCVYLLVRAGEVVYVGQSKNFLDRIGGHKRKKYDSIYIIEAPESALLAIELKYIRKYEPEYNTIHTRKGRKKIKQLGELELPFCDLCKNYLPKHSHKKKYARKYIKGVWCSICLEMLPEHTHLGRV